MPQQLSGEAAEIRGDRDFLHCRQQRMHSVAAVAQALGLSPDELVSTVGWGVEQEGLAASWGTLPLRLSRRSPQSDIACYGRQKKNVSFRGNPPITTAAGAGSPLLRIYMIGHKGVPEHVSGGTSGPRMF